MAAETRVTANGSSDGNLAATYALIYSFLSARSHEKAAAAVKKAVKDIVVIKDNVPPDGASLDEIVKWWKTKKETDAKNESCSESGSSSDSDSSDSSSDDSSNSDLSSGSDSDSSSNSSDSDMPQVAKSGLGSPKAVKQANVNGQANTSRTVVSDHKPKPGTLQDKTSKSTNTTSKNSEIASTTLSSSDSDDSDSDSSVSEPATKSTKAQHAAASLPKLGSKAVTDVSTSATPRTTKKRRLSESGKAVPTATAADTPSPAPDQNYKAHGKKPRKSNTPFQRIKADEVEFHDERLKDNAFVARGASSNDYGARANQDLIVTRGDSFRKEKNKKKRGSYRGGEITMESHSIKFT